jgi:hypothetical protein
MPRPSKTKNGMRECSDCHIEKPVSEFRNMGGKRSHLLSAICIGCQSIRDKERRNTEEYKNRANELRRTDKYRSNERKRTAGLYQRLTEEQRISRRENVSNYARTEQAKQRRKENRRKLREEFFEHYGGCCQCCGESRFEFLTVEHVNGGGRQERKKMSTEHLLRKLKREGYPQDGRYTILCFNCNQAKGAYGYCPHHQQR